MRKVVIYTAVFGSYDPSFPKVSVEKGIDYELVSFTDSPATNNPSGFRLVYVPAYFQDSKMCSLYFRCNPHLFFGYRVNSIWLDSKVRRFNLTKQLMGQTLGLNPVSASFHQSRKTIKEECEAVVQFEFENKIRAETHLLRLANYGLDTVDCLSENTILFRDLSNARVRMANESWWVMMLGGVRRSQLGMDPALKMHGLVCSKTNYVMSDHESKVFTLKRHHRKFPKRLFKKNNACLFAAMNQSDQVAVRERWTEKSLEAIRGLNKTIAESGHQHESNCCHFKNNRIQTLTPADLRQSYKREFLRNAISGKSNIIQVGLGEGYSAGIILSNSYSSRLLVIDKGTSPCSRPCADYLKASFPGRFDIMWGDSNDLLASEKLLNMASSFDFAGIDCEADGSALIKGIQWYMLKTQPDCIVTVTGINDPKAKALLKTLEASGEIIEIHPRMVSNGECRLYQKAAE